MKPSMQQVEVITSGYVTEEKTFYCHTLERCALSPGLEKVEYYVNEKDQLFSIHYAHMLDLRLSVCVIDFFPDYSRDEVDKAAAIILDEIRRKV
ncbi:hypothetical protein [Adhaeribacter rhizoryzae]|uniref:Uncharacterized protein n=1 Tax=Adhaeribacter rhizoryzae TaxID=2607907 RepID=A0A5M6D2W9_9BACT|nr:hypothetical protein [Adhaeribacter rhizoryzae]KAA5541673.1 hypothetical protein F0145_20085 [Adhaeribacter rhizoryzae]